MTETTNTTSKKQAFKNFKTNNPEYLALKKAEETAKVRFETARQATQIRHGVATSTDAINNARYFSAREALQDAREATDICFDTFLETL